MMRAFILCALLLSVCCRIPMLAQTVSQLSLAPDVVVDTCSGKMELTDIRVTGNKHTHTDVILRELSWQKGARFCKDSLDYLLHLNYQRLYNLNVFAAIQLEPVFVSDTLFSLHIQVKEQWFIIPQADLQLADRNINVWWNEYNHDLSRINLGLYVQHKNLSGNLDRLSLSAHMGYTQQLTLSYYRPYIDKKKKQGLSFAVGYSRSKELAFAQFDNKLQFVRAENDFLYRYFFTQFNYIYRQAYHTRHIVGLQYNQYQVGDTVVQLNPFYFEKGANQLGYLALQYRFELNGVDNWNYPRRGHKLVATAEQRLGWVGLSSQTLIGIESGFFKPLPGRFYSSLIIRGRQSFGNHDGYFVQPAMGYNSDIVRGYEYYVIPGASYLIGRVNLKYELLRTQFNHLPFRYLPKLPVWLYPKVFFDAGYASGNSFWFQNDHLSNTFLYAFGLGFDVITAYDLKLRVEFAWNHLGENGLYLHANSE